MAEGACYTSVCVCQYTTSRSLLLHLILHWFLDVLVSIKFVSLSLHSRHCNACSDISSQFLLHFCFPPPPCEQPGTLFNICFYASCLKDVLQRVSCSCINMLHQHVNDYRWRRCHTSRTIWGVFFDVSVLYEIKSSIQLHTISRLLHIMHIQHHQVFKPYTIHHKCMQSEKHC
jgi:hypothetical protein